jgi:hypothetical protein
MISCGTSPSSSMVSATLSTDSISYNKSTNHSKAQPKTMNHNLQWRKDSKSKHPHQSTISRYSAGSNRSSSNGKRSIAQPSTPLHTSQEQIELYNADEVAQLRYRLKKEREVQRSISEHPLSFWEAPDIRRSK